MKNRIISAILILCMTLSMLSMIVLAEIEPIVLTPENPTTIISVLAGNNRVPVTVTAPEYGDVILTMPEYSNGAIFIFETINSTGMYPNYTVKAGKTQTVYIGAFDNTAGTCTIKAIFPNGEKPTSDPVSLTIQKPSALIEVKKGSTGRVPITVTAPDDGYIIITGDYDIWSVDPAFYTKDGKRLATTPNLIHKVNAGETTTIYAGSYNDWAGVYTVKVSYHYIPNLLIDNKQADETSYLLDDYQGQYRLVIFDNNHCPYTISAINYANRILNNWEYEPVTAFVLNDEVDGWRNGYPNLIFSGDSTGEKGYANTVWKLLRPHGFTDVYYTPPVFIMDKGGVIRYYHTGPISEATLKNALISVVSADNQTPIAPTIQTQPSDISTTVGTNVEFSVQAHGYPAPTYQWQVSTNNGISWININDASDATSPSITATLVQNGYQYRCVVSNLLGSVNSDVATLRVEDNNTNVVTMDRSRNRSSIVAMANRLSHFGFDKSKITQYANNPSFSVPYNAGSLNVNDVTDSLNTLKMIRYISGLPYENVDFTNELNNIAQHGAVLLASSNQYTHTPIKPVDMPQNFFELGYQGCNESNIFLGVNANKNISYSILGWVADNGAYNIEYAGHRRWILRPDAQKFGIGFANVENKYYSNLHVFDDTSNREADTYVAWPSSGDFPIQYFTNSTNINTTPNYPWSLNLGEQYQVPKREEIQLTLIRTRDNKVWTFNSSTPQLGEDNMPDDSTHLAVDNLGYGMKKAIIFRPDVTSLGAIQDDDVFKVQLSGIKTKNGTPTTLEYEINFFDLDKAMSEDVLTSTTYQTIDSSLRFSVIPRRTEKPLDTGKIILDVYEKTSGKMLDVKIMQCDGSDNYIIDTPIYSDATVKIFNWSDIATPLSTNEIVNIP